MYRDDITLPKTMQKFNNLKERNCLRDKLSRFSQIFVNFAKLNPRKKSTGSQFAKLNPREKKFFFRFSELGTITFLHSTN